MCRIHHHCTQCTCTLTMYSFYLYIYILNVYSFYLEACGFVLVGNGSSLQPSPTKSSTRQQSKLFTNPSLHTLIKSTPQLVLPNATTHVSCLRLGTSQGTIHHWASTQNWNQLPNYYYALMGSHSRTESALVLLPI